MNDIELGGTNVSALGERIGRGGNSPANMGLSKGDIKKKYCRFKKLGFKFIDYRDPDFLLRFVNDQGKILPRRLTGTSLKFQRRLSQAVKRARHLALLPFVTDSLLTSKQM